MMRRLFALALLIFGVNCIYGFNFIVDGLKYQTGDNNFVYVDGLENPNYSGELTIPEKVTYKEKEYVIKGIDSEAFLGCAGLTSVIIGNSVESIYYGAFKDCTHLTSFSIPASVEYIDEEVFVNTAWYNALPDGLIYKDNVLFGFKGSKAGFEGHLDIADGTRIIAGGALKHTMNITSVKIPNTVISICQGAFFQSGITSISIPSSVRGIYHQAFHWCNKLEKIEVESGNPIYDSRNNCNAIIETGKNQLAFGCKNTAIPNSVTSINDFAFRGHWMNTIIIPKSITYIGSLAFMDCWRLENIYSEIEDPFKVDRAFEDYDEKTLYVPAGTKAKYEATEGWKEFKNIVEMEPTGETLKVWQDPETKVNYEYMSGESEASVKAGQKGLVAGSPEATGDINILSSFFVDEKEYIVTSIGEAAFSGTKITSVHIPPTIQKIGDGAWGDCYSLKKICISDLAAWCTIHFETGFANGFWTGAHLYLNDDDISELVIPDGVTNIKYAAFMLLDNLSSVTIPSSVRTIETGAFMCRSDLQKVVSYIEEPFAIDEHTFDKIIMPKYIPTGMQACNATLYVPAGTKALYEATDGWKEFKNIVEMGTTELEPIEAETTVNTNNLAGQSLADNVVNDVYYNVGSEGYDASDQSIVISQPTNMSQIADKEPGSADVKDNFNGMILKVAKGKGLITVNVKTSGNAQLVVQVGNGTPMLASKTEKGDVVFSYDVEEDTYVYIYAIIGSSAAKGYGLNATDTDSSVRIYSITVSPGATGIRSIEGRITRNDDIIYDLQGRRVKNTAKGVYIVGGRKYSVK